MSIADLVWKDRLVEKPNTFKATTNLSDGTITLERAEGVITEEGTPINAQNMNMITASLSDMDYQIAGGTATAIILTMQTLRAGYAKTFIANATNGGAATTINNKPLYKPGTIISPSLTKDKAYTVWYNLTGDCFFLKASAEGTTIASHVLAGDTFSNDTDTGLVGTIPSKAVATYNPSTTVQTIAAGQYLSGIQTIAAITGTAALADVLATKTFSSANGISLTGTMVNRGAVVMTPTTSNQAIAVGYHNGSGYVAGDVNLVPANIPKGVSLFGVAGTSVLANIYNGAVPSVVYNAAAMPGTSGPRCSTTVGNYIYILAGANLLYRYDTVNNVWAQLATCPGTGNQGGMCSNGTKIFVCVSGSTVFNIYDIGTNTWSTGAAKTTQNMPNCVYYNGYVYALSDTKVILIYNISTNTWSTGASYGSVGRNYSGMTVYNGIIYYICGQGSGLSNGFDFYNVSTNTWTIGSSYTAATGNIPITARYSLAAEAYNGHVYIFGGYSAGQTDVDGYNIATGYWDIMCAKLPNGKNVGIGTIASGIVGNLVHLINVNNLNSTSEHWVFNAI